MTNKNIKKLVSIALTLVVLALTAYAQKHPSQTPAVLSANQPGTYNVSEFDDGDTIQVDMNGTNEKIRFIGVDTPETHDPRKAVQCFGKAAASFTNQQIGYQPVRLEADPLNTNRDRYGRLLRYVYLPSGQLLNAELIKQGYAFAYTGFPFSKMEEFKQYQADAKQQSRGLWADCKPQINQYGGYTSNDAP